VVPLEATGAALEVKVVNYDNILAYVCVQAMLPD
jgi:hypothetical protein